MRNFDLYVSGILYGRLRLGDGTPQIRKLDVHTGALLDWQDLTEQDRDFYRFFVKMDFAALGQNLSQYESGLHGTGKFPCAASATPAKTAAATCSGM